MALAFKPVALIVIHLVSIIPQAGIVLLGSIAGRHPRLVGNLGGKPLAKVHKEGIDASPLVGSPVYMLDLIRGMTAKGLGTFVPFLPRLGIQVRIVHHVGSSHLRESKSTPHHVHDGGHFILAITGKGRLKGRCLVAIPKDQIGFVPMTLNAVNFQQTARYLLIFDPFLIPRRAVASAIGGIKGRRLLVEEELQELIPCIRHLRDILLATVLPFPALSLELKGGNHQCQLIILCEGMCNARQG